MTDVPDYLCEVCLAGANFHGSREVAMERAHLVSRAWLRKAGFQYRGPGLWEDSANIVRLCQPCHATFDWLVHAAPPGAVDRTDRYERYRGRFDELRTRRRRLINGLQEQLTS